MSIPVFESLAVDEDVALPVLTNWYDLMTANITIAAASSKILAMFSACSYPGNGVVTRTTWFRFVLDLGTPGEVIVDCGAANGWNTDCLNNAGCHALFDAVSSGAHVVTVQWTSNIEIHIDAATQPFGPTYLEEATLYLEELPSTGDGALKASDKTPVFVDISTDETANSDASTYKTLVSGNVTTVEASSQLLIVFSGSIINTGGGQGTIIFHLLVDGVLSLGIAYTRAAGMAALVTILDCPTLAAGAHTVTVRWVGDTAGWECQAATNPTYQGAKLLLQEKAA